MRDLTELNKYRLDSDHIPECDYQFAGYFRIVYKGSRLRVIASNDGGWDHVSISLPTRCPSWAEMEFIKRLFFKENEVCWQYHVAVVNHVNIHPYVLHIWRKHDFEMPLPPKEYV